MQINRDFFPLKLKKWFGVLQVYPIMHNILLYDSEVDCIKKSREIDRDHGSRFPLPSMNTALFTTIFTECSPLIFWPFFPTVLYQLQSNILTAHYLST
jgi:hypothetical protein